MMVRVIMQEFVRIEQQAQDITEEMISHVYISQEIGEKEPAEDTHEQGLLNITFIPKYMDIFDGLCATDQADGTGKRARMLFVVLVLLMCVQLVGFFSTQNGFMFVFALLLGDNLDGRKSYIAENGHRYLDDLDVS